MSNDDENATTLFVGNIAENVTEELLYELFLQVGPLDSVRIPPNRNKPSMNRFGFVRFKHAVSTEYAINLLQGITLHECKLNLQRRNKSSSSNNITPQRGQSGRPTPLIQQWPSPYIEQQQQEPNFDMLLQLGANILPYNDNTPTSGYYGNRSNQNQRGYNQRDERYMEDTPRGGFNDTGSRSNRRTDYDYDRHRGESNYRDNDDRRPDDYGGNRRKGKNRSHDKRPYDSRNRGGNNRNNYY